MRGLSTIQQTLTAEAAGVLNDSIAEAAKRGHGQTTPLHVAAILLTAPNGLLRQACIRSHPETPHLQPCRALQLCFAVALDRIPASTATAAAAEPPISNALMAALKRAQANQRRGCPEQQQQPLLAVKVELEQLLMSILDDPSVSRVMREASIASPAVKAALEQSLASSSYTPAVAATAAAPSVCSLASPSPAPTASLVPGLTSRGATPARNLYMNPRLQPHGNNGGSAPSAARGDSAPSAARGDSVVPPRAEDVKRVLDTLLRSKKRNPILAGDGNLDAVLKDALQRIPSIDAPPALRNAQVVPFAKEVTAISTATALDCSHITSKIRDLSNSIDSMIGGGSGGGDRGVILDLGDLTWLVESPGVSGGSGLVQPPKPVVSRAVVEEMVRLWDRFKDGGRVWLVGAAASDTFIRCQVYHPTIESDLDLQVMSIAARLSLPNRFPSNGGSGIHGNSLPSLGISKGILGIASTTVPLRRPLENTDPSPRTNLCPVCKESYERELAKLVAKEFEKYSTKPEASQALPPWLQVAKLSSGGSTKASSSSLQSKEEELLWKKNTDELLRRCCENCSRLHPGFHESPVGLSSRVSLLPVSSAPLGMLSSLPTCEYQSLVTSRMPSAPVLPVPLSSVRSHPEHTAPVVSRMSSTPVLSMPLSILRSHPTSEHQSSPAISKPLNILRAHPTSGSLAPMTSENSHDAAAAKQPSSPPGSPVKTDLGLGLGSTRLSNSSLEKTHNDRLKDFTGCMRDVFPDQQRAKFVDSSDIDTFKKVLKGLTEKVSWQHDAASAVANVVVQRSSGNGKRRSGSSKGDTWLLLLGPDKVGKKKMATALSELMFGTGPTIVSFGSGSFAIGNNEESNLSYRGRTSMDRIVEAVRRNPFSLIVLEDIDQADMLVQSKVKQAIERGRLPDSYGREVSLGSAIFVLTADWLPEELRNSYDSVLQCEKKILDSASCGLELELTTGDKPGKRCPGWLQDNESPVKLRKVSLVSTDKYLDLNLSLRVDFETKEGSWNSSDLTSENEFDKGSLAIKCSSSSFASKLMELVDKAVAFKPVDFALLQRNVLEYISVRFTTIMGKGRVIRIDDDALERIVGGLWLSGAAAIDDWAERVLVPSLKQLRDNLKPNGDISVIRLSTTKGDKVLRTSSTKNWLPATVAIAIDAGHDS